MMTAQKLKQTRKTELAARLEKAEKELTALKAQQVQSVGVSLDQQVKDACVAHVPGESLSDLMSRAVAAKGFVTYAAISAASGLGIGKTLKILAGSGLDALVVNDKGRFGRKATETHGQTLKSKGWELIPRQDGKIKGSEQNVSLNVTGW